MLKLYGGARTRASIVQWYLEEIKIPYEFVSLDMQAGEHRQPDYLAINPMGKVPAIVDGDFMLWESGSILLYIAEKYGQIDNSLENRSSIHQWILFANSTLSAAILMEASRERELPKLFTPLNQVFEKQSYVLGNNFSVADVVVGSLLFYAQAMFKIDLSPYPAAMDYIKRVTERPAFQNTIGKRAA